MVWLNLGQNFLFSEKYHGLFYKAHWYFNCHKNRLLILLKGLSKLSENRVIGPTAHLIICLSTHAYPRIHRHEFYAPLNLPLILQDSLLAFHTPSHPHTPHIHWKLAFIYPPQSTLPPSDKHTLNWLYRKLKTVTGSSVPSKNTELLALYSAPVQGGVLDHWDKQATRKLNVAVQGICSHWRGEVNGASGIMLYAQLPQGESIQVHVTWLILECVPYQ